MVVKKTMEMCNSAISPLYSQESVIYVCIVHAINAINVVDWVR